MKGKVSKLWRREGAQSVAASLISILIGLAVGAVIILIMGLSNPDLGLGTVWEAVRLEFLGLFSIGRTATGALTFGFNPVSMGDMLFRATPLILTGLSVAVAYKTGLFNIGAPGQYLMGTAATLMLALGIPTQVVPAPLVWLIAFLGGALAGALWGCIPGLVKALLNINEVLACIMTNWIAANLVSWIFDGSQFRNLAESTKSAYIYKTSFNGVQTAKLGLDQLFPNSQVNGGILVAIVIAVLMYILMNKTTLGYQLKACGANRHASRYAGIADKRNIVLSMAIAGAFAGVGGAIYYLSGTAQFTIIKTLVNMGFNGIPVALLASSHPIGTIFSSLFISYIQVGGESLQPEFAKEIIDIIIAAIIYLSAFALLVQGGIARLLSRKHERAAGKEED